MASRAYDRMEPRRDQKRRGCTLSHGSSIVTRSHHGSGLSLGPIVNILMHNLIVLAKISPEGLA